MTVIKYNNDAAFLQELDDAYHGIMTLGYSPDSFLPKMHTEYRELLDSSHVSYEEKHDVREMADQTMHRRYGSIWVTLRETIWQHADEGELYDRNA